MDPVNVIRAPSLKRGKPDERLSDRVSIDFFLAIDYLRFVTGTALNAIAYYVNAKVLLRHSTEE